jgi:DNA repair protein RAD50
MGYSNICLLLIYFCVAEEREQLIKDPRKMEIIKEIRDIEDSMEKIRRKIDDESSVLQSLRHTADAQNALVALQEQCDKDIDLLDDNIREESYALNKFEIVTPTQLPRNDDVDGDKLLKVVESMMETAREKYNIASGKLDRSNNDIVDTQKVIAEKSAIISGNQKALTLLKSRQATLTSSIAKVQRTVEELRRHEEKRGYILEITEDNPRELLKYIDEQLEELEEGAPELNASRVAKNVLRRVKKKVRINASKYCCKTLSLTPCLFGFLYINIYIYIIYIYIYYIYSFK